MGELQKSGGFKWSSIVYYIVLFILFIFVFYVPIVLLFPDLINSSEEEYGDLQRDHFWFQVFNVSAFLFAALCSTYVMVRNEGNSLRDFGLTIRLKPLLIGLIIGASTMVAFASVCSSLEIIEFSFNGIGVWLLQSLLLFFFVALAEEIFTRGFLLFKLRQRFGNYGALIITSVLFGLMHVANDHFTWMGCVNISFSGFLMGLLVFKTGSISSAIGVHWAWNFIQGPVFGFAVSGHHEAGILATKALSQPLLTGGEFGAEGSLVLIPITLISTFLIHKHLKPALA